MKKQHSAHGWTKRFRTDRFAPEPYDPERQIPIIRCSICTGEKVAGFKDKKGGHFTEVMLIRSPEDLQEFKERYGVETLLTEY